MGKGYKWQGSKKEKKWCMEAHKDGETVEIKKCSSSSKQKFKFIGDDQIQSCKDKDLCFVLSGKFAKLDKCSSSKNQKFEKKGKAKKVVSHSDITLRAVKESVLKAVRLLVKMTQS